MKILWVKANKILPVHSGGDLRSFNILRQLAANDDVTFFSYYDGPVDADYEREVQGQLPGAICVSMGRNQNSAVARGIDYLTRLPQAAPYAVSRFAAGTVRSRLERCLSEKKPDVLVLDFLDAAIHFPKLPPVPAVLFQHNVESVLWKRHAEYARTFLLKRYFEGQYERMLRYEERVCQAVKRIVAVSRDDARAMQSLYGIPDVAAVPTGVDLDHFAPHSRMSQPTTDLVFLGSMDWRPNIDGVRWFAADILPLIRRRLPDCSLAVVGRLPTGEIRRLAEADARIQVTGTVPDVRPYLWESAVSIVPLRVGGGTRLKIYEAMAARVPVVSTSIGAEGLDVRDGENIALADSPEAFAERCLALLGAAEVRRKQAQAAWEMVSACYSWEVVARKFEQLLI